MSSSERGSSERGSTMRVVIMNDHAAALGAWLSVLAPPDPPATVLHIDRHSDLASPSQCDARATLRGDRATWARCADRAGFQLAAACNDARGLSGCVRCSRIRER